MIFKDKTEDRIFGVDGPFYLHRLFNAQKFESKDPALTQARAFLSMICKDAGLVRAKRILVTFDGWAIFRYKLYELYKANRGNDGPSGVYDHLQYLKDYLGAAGIPVLHLKQYEGDDLLCSLAHLYKNVVIGCRDKDAYQYVRPGCSLIDTSSKPEPTRLCDVDIERITGLHPAMHLDYQTLIGDKIDNVPQLMKPSQAKELLLDFGTIKAWAAADRSHLQWCKNNQTALNLNRKLVRLVPDIPIEVPAIKWTDSKKVPQTYMDFKAFAAPKSKGLF